MGEGLRGGPREAAQASLSSLRKPTLAQTCPPHTVKVLLDPHSWKAAGRERGEWERKRVLLALVPEYFFEGRNTGSLLHSSQGSDVTSFFEEVDFPELPCSEG